MIQNNISESEKIPKVEHNGNPLISYNQYDGYSLIEYLRHYLHGVTNNPVIEINMGYVRYSKTESKSQIKTIIDSECLYKLKDIGFQQISFRDNYDDSISTERLYKKGKLYLFTRESEYIGKSKVIKGKKFTDQPIIESIHFVYADVNDLDLIFDSYVDVLNILGESSSTMDKSDEDIYLSIIVKKHYGYAIQDRKIDDNHIFENIDLHYGDGFEEKYNRLVEVAKRNRKGLVVFHGKPGTGKTYCIKDFIRRLDNKKPVYITSDIFEQITSPEFIEFLMNESDLLEREEDNLLFIVEDAEKLIQKRDDYPNTGGISNLLNATDGLLNGMINIQAILTFNTDIKNIDPALLRSERLIGQIEFGEISTDRAKKLVEHLGIESVSDKFYEGKHVVADIYALLKDREVITHELEQDKDKFIL